MAKRKNALNCYINIDKYWFNIGAGRETGFDFYKTDKTNNTDMKKILISLIFTAMAAVSCNNKTDINGDWKITSIGGEKITLSEAGPSLSFDKETGRIHGYTGVNIVNGEYELDGRRLSLKGLGTTMMAGPEEDMELERKITGSFEKISTVKQSADGGLTLYDSEGNALMTLVRR